MSSYVVSKEQCPACHKLGKDNSHDNLAIYSDGHKYCYSCGHLESLSTIKRIKYQMNKQEDRVEEPIYLPSDCDTLYPIRALEWIEQYELTKTDLLNHNVMWSDSIQRLIFPIYGDGHLIAWQGRSFHLGDMAIAKIPKWFGKGNLSSVYNILGKGDRLVITEDIISAIKVSRCGVMSMPLYGSFIGRERFKRLYNLYGDQVEISIWLDPDKRTEALKEAKLGEVCGLHTTVIYSNKDPKEHTYEEIKNILI